MTLQQSNTAAAAVAVSVTISQDDDEAPNISGGRKSAGSTKGADGKMCNRKTSTSLFPPIEVNNNVNGAGPSNAARKLSNVFAKTLAASRAGHRPSDAMFLGAYASMFGNKLKSSRRTSMAPSIGSSSNIGNAPQVVELPSYRLEPLPKHVIRWSRLQILLDSMLVDFINRGSYNRATAPQSVKNISQNIKSLARELGYSKRYRIVVTVEIGQNMGQGFKSVSRCLWNTELDGSATSYKSSPSVFIVASLYMVYMD